jgi:predicted small secreted protein
MVINKKMFVWPVLLLALILVAGCQTIKGAGTGAAEGAKKDWQALEKADAWMRKNLW